MDDSQPPRRQGSITRQGSKARQAPQDLESGSVQLDRALTDAPECRICLGPATDDDPLHTVCNCHGSVGLCHISCLTRWATEKRSLKCEICKSEYIEPFHSQLKDKVEAARRAHQAQLPLYALSEAESELLPPAARWRSIVWHIFIIFIFVSIIIYISVFSNIAWTGGESWTGILWRSLVALILFYCLVRCVYALVLRWRVQRNLRRLMESARAAQAEAAQNEGDPSSAPGADTSMRDPTHTRDVTMTFEPMDTPRGTHTARSSLDSQTRTTTQDDAAHAASAEARGGDGTAADIEMGAATQREQGRTSVAAAATSQQNPAPAGR